MGASDRSIEDTSRCDSSDSVSILLKRSLLACNKNGVSPGSKSPVLINVNVRSDDMYLSSVHLALLCQKTDLVILRDLLVGPIDLKSKMSPISSFSSWRVNSKVAEQVDIEDLFRTTAEENERATQLLQSCIENPMRPTDEDDFNIRIAGGLITHHQCCILNLLSRMLNRVENQWRKLCRY